MVDDIVGVSEAGIKAQKMNSFINLKTAEKSLKFGVEKCKSMVIESNTEVENDNKISNNKLSVDRWSMKYEESSTGEAILTEHYLGQSEIESTKSQKYLGFVLSSTGDNMANINPIKKKAIGVVSNKLHSLNLKFYYFGYSTIFLNVLVRSSILYASELKEDKVHQLERIEEQFMRKILNTTKSCPIVALYLTLGQIPAGFQIQKMKVLYLKYILSEDEESLILKFFFLQLENQQKAIGHLVVLMI